MIRSWDNHVTYLWHSILKYRNLLKGLTGRLTPFTKWSNLFVIWRLVFTKMGIENYQKHSVFVSVVVFKIFFILNCFLWLWTMPAAMKSSLLACSFLLLNQCCITNEIECVLSANVRMHHFLTFLNSTALECTLFSVSGVLGMTGCPACRLFLDLSLEGVNLDC